MSPLQFVLLLVGVSASLSHQYYGPSGPHIVEYSPPSSLIRLVGEDRQPSARSQRGYTEVELHPNAGLIRYYRSTTGAILYQLADGFVGRITKFGESTQCSLHAVREVVLFESPWRKCLESCVETVKGLLQQKEQISADKISLKCGNIDMVVCQVNIPPPTRTLHDPRNLPRPPIKFPPNPNGVHGHDVQLGGGPRQPVSSTFESQDILSHLYQILDLKPLGFNPPSPAMPSLMGTGNTTQAAPKLPCIVDQSSPNDLLEIEEDPEIFSRTRILEFLQLPSEEDESNVTDGVPKASPEPKSNADCKRSAATSLPPAPKNSGNPVADCSAPLWTNKPPSLSPPESVLPWFPTGRKTSRNPPVKQCSTALHVFLVGECVLEKVPRRYEHDLIGPFIVVGYDEVLDLYRLSHPGIKGEYMFVGHRLKHCTSFEKEILDLFQADPRMRPLKINDKVAVVDETLSSDHLPSACEMNEKREYVVQGLETRGQYQLRTPGSTKVFLYPRKRLRLVEAVSVESIAQEHARKSADASLAETVEDEHTAPAGTKRSLPPVDRGTSAKLQKLL